jgi:hypothetical protein
MKVPAPAMLLPTLLWLSLPGCASPDHSSGSSEDRGVVEAATALERDHVDLYWNTLIVHLTRPVIGTGDLSSRQALNEMIGVISVEAVPSYKSVSESCVGAALDDPATRSNCRAAAAAFERGDTVITEMEGADIAQRLWPKDSSEWLAASQVGHLDEYRAAQLRQSGHSDIGDDRSADEFLALCARSPREQDVEIAELVAAGKNPTPPPSWTP